MALWHQFRRHGIHRLLLSGQNPSFLHAPLRSFAVPAHVKAKQTAESSGPRLNDAITSAYVRLVTDDGHGVVSRREALDRAKKLNLDLVEVQRTANPPVCKLMDYHKEKFKQDLKEKEKAKSKSALTLRSGENKEVRFTAKTEAKDLKIKADRIIRLMERGYRVKCTVLPSGNEEEDLLGLMSRILALIDDVAVLESGPHVVETRQAYIIVRHSKFSTKKSGKKLVKALDAVTRIQVADPEAVTSSIKEDTSVQAKEWELDEGSDSESEHLSDQADRGIQQQEYKSTSSSKISQKQPLTSEPSAVQMNRYAKKSEPNSFQQSRERMSHQATRNQSSPRIQFDPKGRQFNNPSSPRSPPPPGNGNYSYERPAASVDQNRMRNPAMVSPNDPRNAAFSGQKPNGPTMGKPTDQNSSTPRYGQSSTSNPASARDQRNLGAVGDNRNPSSTPSYGVFNSSRTAPTSNQRNSGEATGNQTGNPTSQAKSFGIFSSAKPAASGDQSSTNNLGASKPVGSVQQKGSNDASPGGTSNSGSASKSYGIFSKPKTGSSSV